MAHTLVLELNLKSCSMLFPCLKDKKIQEKEMKKMEEEKEKKEEEEKNHQTDFAWTPFAPASFFFSKQDHKMSRVPPP